MPNYRRIKLGRDFVINGSPKVTFNNNFTEMTLTFKISSRKVPANTPADNDGQEYRDIEEKTGNLLSGASIGIQLLSSSATTSSLQINADLESKIPGTGSFTPPSPLTPSSE